MKSVCVGMAIQARPAGTRPNPTLMGQVLSGPIKDRVGYGFKTKKSEAGLGRAWVLMKPGPNPTRLRIKLLTYPYIYIYIYI